MKAPQKGNTCMFARPLESQTSSAPSMLDRLNVGRPSPGLALAGLVLAASAALLLQPRPDGAQNLSKANKKSQSKSAARMQLAMAERGDTAGKAAETARPPLDFYTKGVR